MTLTSAVRGLMLRRGFEIRRTAVTTRFDARTEATIDAVRSFTMTSPERIAATCDAIRYVQKFSIPGAVVECGVWAGGSMMAAARTLQETPGELRDLYLFDTFEGMSEPTDVDRSSDGAIATELMQSQDRLTGEVWCYASLPDVERNLATTGYSPSRLHFVKGKVEETIPQNAPESIAVLRLDTDWYESTKHELEHLIDRVSPGGVLLIDDYGHWEGARRAVDEWLEQHSKPVLLCRVDYTGRIAVLP